MLEKQFVTRSEWKKHTQVHPLIAHGIWAKLKNYVPGFGYSQAEINAFFEGETGGGKKQVHWDSLTNKPGTFPPSAHTHLKADITNTPWAWADVSKTGSNLTHLATRQHAGLTNVTANQHHAESHTLASHSTKPHSALTDVTSGQHHAQLHEAAHRSGGGDSLNHDLLAGFLAAEHKSLPNTIAQVLSDHNVAAHNALDITELGTVSSGVWQGTAIANAYIAGIDQNLLTSSSPTFADLTLTGDLNIADDKHVYLGATVQIRANGTNLFIRNFHAGEDRNIYLQASDGGILRDVLKFLGSENYTRIYNPRNQSAVALALITRKLDDFGTPDDNTDLNASTTRHGLLKKLGGGTENFLRADGAWAAPTPGAHAASHEVGGGDLLAFADITGFSTWIDQAVKQASSPTFVGLTLTGDLIIADTKHIYFGSTGEIRQTGTNLFIRNFHAGEDRNIYLIASDGGIERTVLQYTGAENYTRIYDPRDAAGNALALVSALHAENHASRHHVAGADLVNHDSLTGFVANEHINHGSVSMIAGSGLSGGGTIAANRTFNLGLLTAAWDAGGYQIRALKFYSDQATGVAPFTVLSTTKVTNLNADLLEGYHASSAAGNNTVVLRTAAGYIYCNYLNTTSGETAANPTHYFVETGNDSFLRQMTPANFVAALKADGLGGGLTTYFRAYRSTAQAFATGTDTRVSWNAEKYDIGGNFASYVFTAPATGYYYLHASLILSSLLAGTSVYIRFRKAGSTTLAQTRCTGPAGFRTVEVSAQLYLTSGTWVEVIIYHNAGFNLNISPGDTNSWFEGHRLDA